MTAWSCERDQISGAYEIRLRMSRVLHHEPGEHQEIVLFENPLFGRTLALDGVVQTTERDEFFYHEMLVHVPMHAHGAVRRALVIGGGDGGAIEELFKHPTLERATMVEIDAGVVEFSKRHLRAICGEAFEDPRLDLVIDDGAAFVAASDRRFDLILIDSTDAAMAGPAAGLFTAGFYRDCAARLADDGLLVTQNSVPFAEPESLIRPVAALRESFAEVTGYRVAVPSFYGGDMVFALATKQAGRFDTPQELLEARHAAGGFATRYYTPAIHRGAFALPPYLAELIAT